MTAGSRSSPQVNIVAHIARFLRVPCRVHTPSGTISPEVAAAVAAGATLVQHNAGYNNVIICRAREDAAARPGWVNIPFGMECREAVLQTAAQTKNIPEHVSRIVVPIGSGMSLAGVLHGLHEQGRKIPVLGVAVGADPIKRLQKFSPFGWAWNTIINKTDVPYHAQAKVVDFMGIRFDPIYEAKCIEFLRPGDLFWVVGLRQTAQNAA